MKKRSTCSAACILPRPVGPTHSYARAARPSMNHPFLAPQAWMLGAAPMPVAAVALLLAGGAAATNAVLLGSGALLTAPRAAAAWRLWRGVLGAVGFAMLPQVGGGPRCGLEAGWLQWVAGAAAACAGGSHPSTPWLRASDAPQVLYMSTLLPASGSAPGAAGSASWAPAAVGLSLFAALALALRAGRLPRSCWEVWDAPAWAATLLFMLEPLTVLVRLLLWVADRLGLAAAAARGSVRAFRLAPCQWRLHCSCMLTLPNSLLPAMHPPAGGGSPRPSVSGGSLPCCLPAAGTGDGAAGAACTAGS